MFPGPHLSLAIAIVLEVIGTLCLKQSTVQRSGEVLFVAVAAYGGAFYMLSHALRAMPIGIAYAIWSGVGIVLIALSGWLFMRQTLDAPALVGIALILAGVLVINTLSDTVRLI